MDIRKSDELMPSRAEGRNVQEIREKREKRFHSLPSVMSMGRQSRRKPDYPAIFVAVFMVLLLAFSTLFLFRYVKLPPVTVKLDSINKILEEGEEIFRKFMVSSGSRKRRGGQEDTEYSRLLQRGYGEYAKGRFDSALKYFGRAVERKPGRAEAYYWRGRAFLGKEEFENAESHFRTAVRLNDRYGEALDNLAWLSIRKGDDEQGLRFLNESIRLKADNGWALYNRGRILFKKGERERALEDALKACRLGYKDACDVYEKYK